MKKRKSILTLIILSLALVLAACGGNGTENGNGEQQGSDSSGGNGATSSIIIATGGTTGTYYALGGALAVNIEQKTNINSSAQSTGASAENMRLLRTGDVDLAFTQGDIADYAVSGSIMFEADGAIENIQGIASLYNETIQIVVAEDSDIQSVEDLAGKRVSVGAPGSGTEANAEQILEIYGMTFDDLGRADRLAFGESTSFIQDGSLDAAFVTAGTPTAAVNELAATRGVRIVGLDDSHIADLIDQYPYYAEEIIPAGTYSGFDEEIKTVAVKAQLVVRSELEEDAVYEITKALFESIDALGSTHEKGSHISLDTALEGLSLELHPGAIRYYDEQGIQR
ncbi:TAXI family TRAP transporter solute-binding subunit [Bacillus horti]|uniref:TRAP transporter TAXI family solute receptor n=1 Tax=Caldalkalibacillus horti TaxID=77523 RepID=A0ABT9VV67_9BACI|nr:TAXI family TRAP transporter solute-binding subunit [Bacillus horti]MDQ0164520.1 TRAP transporter TAXI family solute receptor [Bacillus horti]